MFNFIIDYYPMFLKGTGITILLALLTVFFGTLIESLKVFHGKKQYINQIPYLTPFQSPLYN